MASHASLATVLQGPAPTLESEGTTRLFEAMVATSTDQMAYVDRDGIVLAANPALVEAASRRAKVLGDSGVEMADLLGRPLSEILGEDFFLSTVQPNLDRALDGETVGVQRWIEMPGAPPCFLHWQFLPRKDESGRVAGVVSVIRDLTAEKRVQSLAAELATDESVVAGQVEDAAALLSEQVAENLVVVDRASFWLLRQDGRELHCVDAYDPITGRHQSGEVLRDEECPAYFASVREGKVLDVADVLDDRRTVELAVRMRPRRVASLLQGPVRVGGRVVGVLVAEVVGASRPWQAAEVSFVTEVAGIFAQTLASDERRRLERRLFQAQKMESLGVMAGGVAHDFNNLLTGILAHSEMMLAETSHGSQLARRLTAIRDQTVRASELCTQMLACTGKQDFHPEPIDLSELVRDVVASRRASMPAGTQLEMDLHPLPPVPVGVAALHQALGQLLANAAEALEGEGEIVVSTRLVELDPEANIGVLSGGGWVGEPLPPGRYVSVRVLDDGCGMDESTLEKVFDPFYSTKFTGRGLGLASVLGTARSHDGGVRLRSQPGRGTCVDLLLPLAQ